MTRADVGPVLIARENGAELLRRARRLTETGRRTMLGITGGPGAGKSTLAAELVAALGDDAVLLPMDGFHFAQERLVALGRVATKGAIDTFDVGGFVHLLSRLSEQREAVVYAPAFRRDLEEPIAGAIAISATVPLVVVEGNYLLADRGGWELVRPHLAEVWYLEPAEDVRLQRLIERHMAYGRDRAAAEERSLGSDQINAVLIAATRDRADVVVTG